MRPSPVKWQVIPSGGPHVESVGGTVEAFLAEAWRRFCRASRKGLENPEHAHQARVWSRRAGAALWLYRDWFDGQAYRRVQKGLQALRLLGVLLFGSF